MILKGAEISRYLERRYDILLKMDVDGDGRTTLEDIAQVVGVVTAKQKDEAGRTKPLIGKPRITAPPTKI